MAGRCGGRGGREATSGVASRYIADFWKRAGAARAAGGSISPPSLRNEQFMRSFEPHQRWMYAAWCLAQCLQSGSSASCGYWRKLLDDCPRGQLDSLDYIPPWLIPVPGRVSPVDLFHSEWDAEQRCKFGKQRLGECIESFGDVKYCDLWRDMLKHCSCAEGKDTAAKA